VRTGLPGRPRKSPARAKIQGPDEYSCYVNTSIPPEYTAIAETPITAAIKGPDAIEWRKAIKDELFSHIENETWDIVNRPKNQSVIGCRIVLRDKLNSDGSIARRKARLVAKGFSQKLGVDFRETFAPVTRMSSIRTICALAVQNDLEIQQLDITTAYLNGKIDEEIYMEIPDLLQELLPEMINECEDVNLRDKATRMLQSLKSGQKACLLRKALYGLKQAGRQWHLTLRNELRRVGAHPSNGDASVYTAARNGKRMIIAAYVDDLIIANDDSKWIADIKKELKRNFKLRDLGRIQHCLGLEFDQSNGKMFICQEGYTKSLL